MKKNVHGTFTSLEALAKALGIKSKKEVEKTRKCKNCGEPLRHIQGTNTWLCDTVHLTDEKLKDGTEVQVFTPCGNVVLSMT